MLIQRVLTALLLGPMVLWGIAQSSTPLFALILGIVFLQGAWEWTRICSWRSAALRIAYLAVLALLMAGLYQLMAQQNWVLSVFVLALMWWTMALLAVFSYAYNQAGWYRNGLVRALVGGLILLPSWLALVVMHGWNDDGPYWVIFLLLLIWAADSGAYFAGRLWGRHKLAPAVSPGKTWEGVFGGLLAALLLAWGALSLLPPPLPFYPYLMLVIATVLISVLGDLTESLFKRLSAVKDSGGLLPGHGGLLDRIDSITAAAPLFAMGMIWLA